MDLSRVLRFVSAVTHITTQKRPVKAVFRAEHSGNSLEKGRDSRVEMFGDFDQGAEGKVPLSALDLAHMAAIQAA